MPGHELEDVINQRLNLYDVLELPTPLDVHTIYDDLPQIKRKYRTLALKYHPDKHPDNPSIIHKFHLLSTATNILTNADVRPHYDQIGRAHV